MIGTKGAVFNTNRIMRVTISAPNGGSSVFEYCPMDKDTLNAKMDVAVRMVPAVKTKQGKPGFTAKIKIYNPPYDVVSVINQHANWAVGSKSLSSYYNGRCTVTVEAGYWRDEKGGRDYTMIFGGGATGWLNTSSYYRKGVDNILELYCHNLRITDSQYLEMVSSVSVKRQGAGAQLIRYNDYKNSSRTNKAGETWSAFIGNVIREFAEYKAPKDMIGSLGLNPRTRLATLVPEVVSDGDRAGLTGKWFEVRFIKQPSRTMEPGYAAVDDADLRGLANTTGPARHVTLNGGTFREKMNQLCKEFPGGLNWFEDLTFVDGVTRYYFWQPEYDSRQLNAEAKQGRSILVSKPDIIIYNFQNMLEVPSVDGAGCFTMKMLFNAAVEPGNGLMLKWDPEKVHGHTISGFTEGVMSTTQMGQYFPSLQAGNKQANIAALLGNNGYLFDVTFRVGYVTHNLSTHTNTWNTEVKTLSIMAKPKGN